MNAPCPFVSVIVPVFNGSRTIRRTIESLLQLDYPSDRFEIIIVDNNSRDDTATVIKQFPVTYALEDKVQTSYAARNTGARMARGEILAFTDGDCVADRQWLREGVAAFGADETIGSVGGRIQAFQSDGPQTVVERFQHYNGAFEEANQTKTGDALPFAIGGNVLYRRATFEELGGFRGALRTGGDADLSWKMQLQTNYRLVFSDKAIVYHQHIQTFGQMFERAQRYGDCNTRGVKEYSGALKFRRWPMIRRGWWNLFRHFIAATLAVLRHNVQLLRDDVAVEKIAPVMRFLVHANVHLGQIKASARYRTFFP